MTLTCLVVVFLLLHSSGRLSSGGDLLPSCLQQWASIFTGWMASAGVGMAPIHTVVPLLWALQFSEEHSWGRFLYHSSIILPSPFEFLSFPHCYTCHLCTLFLLHVNSVELAKDGWIEMMVDNIKKKWLSKVLKTAGRSVTLEAKGKKKMKKLCSVHISTDICKWQKVAHPVATLTLSF